jgi:CBS domain-containing protein
MPDLPARTQNAPEPTQENIMQAAQVMSPGAYCVPANASVFDAAELMVNAEVSALPVLDSAGKLVGIVSEADLIQRPEIHTQPRKSWLQRLFAADASSASDYVGFHSRRVADVMTKNVITVQEDATLGEVVETMSQHRIKRVPVLCGEKLVGMLSRANLLQALLSREPQGTAAQRSDDELRRDIQAVVGKQPWASPWPINILVNSGVAHLWGFVPSEAASKAYRVAAENVAGVKKVKNHMRRVPSTVGMGI